VGEQQQRIFRQRVAVHVHPAHRPKAHCRVLAFHPAANFVQDGGFAKPGGTHQQDKWICLLLQPVLQFLQHLLAVHQAACRGCCRSRPKYTAILRLTVLQRIHQLIEYILVGGRVISGLPGNAAVKILQAADGEGDLHIRQQ